MGVKYSTNAKVRVHERANPPNFSTRFLTISIARNITQCLGGLWSRFLLISLEEKSLHPIFDLK